MRILGRVVFVIGLLIVAGGTPAVLRDAGHIPAAYIPGLVLVIGGAFLSRSRVVKRIAAFAVAFPIAFFGVVLFWAAVLPREILGGLPGLIIVSAVILSAVAALLLPFRSGGTLLHRTARVGQTDKAELLLANKAEANANNDAGRAPLKRDAIVFVMLAVVIMAMLAAGKYLDGTRKHGPIKLVGDVHNMPAPDFELPTLDGRKVKLSDFRGQAVLLNFWATWCPPCKIEMPWFVDMQKQYGKDGLVVLGVAMDDTESAKIAEFAHEMGVNYPVLLGTDQVSDDYGDVRSLPTTFYIDRNGTIVAKSIGLLGRQEIEDDVKKALSAAYKPASQLNRAEAKVKSARAKEATQ